MLSISSLFLVIFFKILYIPFVILSPNSTIPIVPPYDSKNPTSAIEYGLVNNIRKSVNDMQVLAEEVSASSVDRARLGTVYNWINGG